MALPSGGGSLNPPAVGADNQWVGRGRTTDGDAPIKVLVVEDHQMVAEALSGAIDATGDLEVVATAASVEQAIAAAEAGPDVALVDYQLPDGNGAEVVEALHAQVPDLPVVMLTAMTGDEVLTRAVEVGCAGFLRKSAPIASVVDALRAAAAGESYFAGDVLSELVGRIRSPVAPLGADLTPRELEVLELLARGFSTDQIADTLFVSQHTSRNHVRNILAKLDARSQLHAVAIAAKGGLIDFDALGPPAER